MTQPLKGPFDKMPVTELICFSHLRWDFVYQRPQHLMSRFNRFLRVFFWEEPIFYDGDDRYDIRQTVERVFVVTPFLNTSDQDDMTVIRKQQLLLEAMMQDNQVANFVAWYYTPMALKFSNHLTPKAIVYDCMDELSAFKFAPPELKQLEAALLRKADVVFTGGYSLYEAKQHLHANIFPFPSSIEKSHFAKARDTATIIPADQSNITGRKFGFYGVIDERFNIKLISEVAAQRPDWQIILIGPVVKINPDDLPQRNNIHYLGGKSYKELPLYLAGWDMAMIPFEKNESTQFISPTKTPEYLAGGKPVISTSIADVVIPYGQLGLVYIADDAESFIAAAEHEFAKQPHEIDMWLDNVDDFLKHCSWDAGVDEMTRHITEAILSKQTGTTVLATTN